MSSEDIRALEQVLDFLHEFSPRLSGLWKVHILKNIKNIEDLINKYKISLEVE